MKAIYLPLAFFISLFMVTGVSSQRRKAPPKRAAKPAAQKVPPKVTPKPQETKLGKEERELAAPPKPTSVKLPDAERQHEDMSKNPLRGTFDMTFSYGYYNFLTRTENKSANASRELSLPWDGTGLFGMDLAFRLGHDKEDEYDSGSGFHYYRSNRGIFTDFELGFKTQAVDPVRSRFNLKTNVNGVSSDIPVALGSNGGTDLAPVLVGDENLTQAGISSALRQKVGGSAFEGTMVYANTYYHLTPLNMLMNWGHAFRWFDASLGPSLRVWYYRDYSDPVRITSKNDDWTRATFMIVYRQYIQFHPMVRLSTRFYFPALSYFGELARSSNFNEKEYILNASLDFYLFRASSVGLIASFGYEGHWWYANPYSSDRFLKTGFKEDAGVTDANYAGYEQTSRSSYEGFFALTLQFHFEGK